MSSTFGFEIIDEAPLPEYHATGVWARHVRTGLELYHMRNDDRENLFSFVFKTIPRDSTGVAHILEHTVLCGSKRYPVKDPFVQLMRGSLNTFVNAMTYPDKTVYPASSTVRQDLFNIMKVYGDAVFSPLLRREFFRQEGHRLVVTDDGGLDITGVVYNEMKGNYADHDSIVAEWSYRSLLPDTPYGFDAGGDPTEIPDLSYDQFVEFHREYYHPSNGRVFLYGDIPTEVSMEFLDTEFLSQFERRDVDIRVTAQPRWTEPRQISVSCPADESGGGPTSITVGWLLDSVTDPQAVLSFELLSEILLGTSAAPLRKRLIDSGLGEDLSAGTGLETELLELVFSAGLRGTGGATAGEVTDIVLDELGRLVREGIHPDIVEAALRKFEFRNRELKGGPNGLRMMGRSLRGWLHGERPDATLRFEEPFSRLRKEAAPGSRYFESIIERSLLHNPHRCTVTVAPDLHHVEREQKALVDRLSRIETTLSRSERDALLSEQEALARLQAAPDSPEAVASIPFLKVGDLPTQVETIPTYLLSDADGVAVYGHDLFTNGIIYADLVFDLSGVDPSLLSYLPFFAGALYEVGLPDRSFDQVATEIALNTGGLSGSVDASVSVQRFEIADRRLFVRMKSLVSTARQALELVRQILVSANLDNADRLADLWKERRSEMSGAVLPAGSAFASLRAARRLSDAHRYDELWQGISQLEFLNSSDRDLTGAMHALSDGLIRRGNLTINLTADADDLTAAMPAITELIAAIPAGGWSGESPGISAPYPAQEALIVPSDVAYVAAAVPGSRFGSADHVHELILAHLLRTGYLWETVRMQGGAYGAHASARGMEGLFAFASYRDPRIVETLAAYREGLARYAAADTETRELELAQIGVTGHDIRPLSPGQKGLVALRRKLYGVTDAMRQQKRDAILAANPADIRRAAQRLHATMDQASIAVLAGADAVKRASERYPALAEHQVIVPM